MRSLLLLLLISLNAVGGMPPTQMKSTANRTAFESLVQLVQSYNTLGTHGAVVLAQTVTQLSADAPEEIHLGDQRISQHLLEQRQAISTCPLTETLMQINIGFARGEITSSQYKTHVLKAFETSKTQMIYQRYERMVIDAALTYNESINLSCEKKSFEQQLGPNPDHLSLLGPCDPSDCQPF